MKAVRLVAGELETIAGQKSGGYAIDDDPNFALDHQSGLLTLFDHDIEVLRARRQ